MSTELSMFVFHSLVRTAASYTLQQGMKALYAFGTVPLRQCTLPSCAGHEDEMFWRSHREVRRSPYAGGQRSVFAWKV